MLANSEGRIRFLVAGKKPRVGVWERHFADRARREEPVSRESLPEKKKKSPIHLRLLSSSSSSSSSLCTVPRARSLVRFPLPLPFSLFLEPMEGRNQCPIRLDTSPRSSPLTALHKNILGKSFQPRLQNGNKYWRVYHITTLDEEEPTVRNTIRWSSFFFFFFFFIFLLDFTYFFV